MRILGFVLLICLSLISCSSDNSTLRADVRVLGTLTTPTIFPTATITPPPTSLPLPTLAPTPRKVTVSRINDTIDPTDELLLKEGQPVPPIVLTDIDGNIYQLDQYIGQVVIVNFWTVGCGSCFYEFPLLQQIRNQLSEEQLLILSVNISDFAEETRILAQQLGATYPMVIDPVGEIFTTYFGGSVVPTTFFIDANGQVFDGVIGPVDQYLVTSHLEALGLKVSFES